ncbi:retrovirus-related Pol polyprotein from transposon 17.6 [Trichonephila clavipes]|nr:retrovirus-related Pol polyprotein from transposon 17.6 [Trichonephila clavipes]
MYSVIPLQNIFLHSVTAPCQRSRVWLSSVRIELRPVTRHRYLRVSDHEYLATVASSHLQFDLEEIIPYKKIGGKTEIMRDTPIIADHKESLIGSKTKVSQIIGDSRVDAKVDNRISDSTIMAVDKHCGTRERRNLLFWRRSTANIFHTDLVKRRRIIVTAQGAPCSHLGRVELQIRIREFQKPWEFHILDNMQYQCILGIDFMKASRFTLDFDQKSLIIPGNQIKQLPKIEKPVDIDHTDTKLGNGLQRQLKALFNNFKVLFSDQLGLTHVLYHEIDTGDKGPVVSRPYRYERVKQGIIDYHIDKMLRDGTICPITSPYASPVVLARKKNDLPPDSPEAYRFAIDSRKINGITKYPQYSLPVIDDLLTNIPRTGVMSTLDLRSGYFQLAISPKDIEKTAFITRNGTFAFLRMPFGLSGAAPNFQKAIDIILKPIIGHFVLVYMDDVIITSLFFKDHLDHLNQFNLFTDASGVGIGAVLQHNQKPIAFASRTLNKAERNYTVTERECLALIWALNKFKTYFGPLPVKVITDNAALTKLTNGKNLSSWMIRWALKLSEFNIEWEHRPGVQNVVADLLSRNPVDSIEGSQISYAALRALAINSREQFIREQREDPELGHIYRYLENPDDGSVNTTVCEG